MSGTDYRYHRIRERKGNELGFLVSQIASWIYLNLPQGSKLGPTSLSVRLEAKQCSMAFMGLWSCCTNVRPVSCICTPYKSRFSILTQMSKCLLFLLHDDFPLLRMGASFPASSQPFADCASMCSPFPDVCASGREVLLSKACMIPFSLPEAPGEWNLTQNLFA